MTRTFASSSSSSSSSSAPPHEGQIKIAHILMDASDEAQLDELYERVVAGADDLATLAAEYSKCPSGKANGGLIGWIGRGQTVKPFEDAAFATPIGGVTRAKTTFGVHVVQVLDQREAPAAVVNVSVEDLAEVLEVGDLDGVNLVDVREEDEWRATRIDAFTLMPLSKVMQMTEAEWDEKLAGVDKSKPTYMLCKAGVRSAHAGKEFASRGFKEVYNVMGGMDAWGRRR